MRTLLDRFSKAGLLLLTVAVLATPAAAQEEDTPNPLDVLIENFTVGAMNAEAALSRFRRQQNKVVITGGDRTDIQLAALETSTSGLILTGNLKPSPLILDQAEKLGVPVLLVETSTMETVEKIEQSFGKTRLGQTEKLETFQQLMEENIKLDTIYEVLGLD